MIRNIKLTSSHYTICHHLHRHKSLTQHHFYLSTISLHNNHTSNSNTLTLHSYHRVTKSLFCSNTTLHCHSSSRTSKKRAHPLSLLDNMIATPAKKTKLNKSPKNADRNCLINLEQEARHKLCELTVEAIKNVYNIDLDEKQQTEFLYTQLSRPKHDRGEISLPCFRLSKTLKSKPNKIAIDLVSEISKSIQENTGVLFLNNPFQKVEAANGRINAYLTASFVARIIPKILNKNNCFLSCLPSNGERVMVEYSQPNTHKAFHVGHMRNVALGDCLVRLFTHCGYETVAANYFGDEGAHVAKCVWWIKKQMDQNALDLDFIEKSCTNLGEWLGKQYADSVEKLTLSTYTRFAYVGVIVAKVISIKQHPNAQDATKKVPKGWNVVQVEYILNEEKQISTVVCGGTEYKIGDLVAYTPIGARYKDKVAEKKDMKGVISEGVIMGALELGVKLAPLKQTQTEEEAVVVDDEDINKKKKGGKKKGKKKKKKIAKVKDQRIFIVNSEYPDAQIGETLIELGKYDETCKNVEALWSTYVAEQKDTLKLLESDDKTMVALWQRTRKWSLDEFRTIYKWVGARFDTEFFESECSADSRKLVEEYYEKGIFVESEGAKGIHLDNEKLGFCMLLKSNGSGLYATKDLSLARQKFEKFNIDRSIYVVDATQSHHFKQVFATLKRMGYKQGEKCEHLSYAFVRLASGKMATRTGNVILFSDLVKLLAREINDDYLNEKRKDVECKWSEDELNEAERAISSGAIRYGMLNHDNNKEIIFDLKKWTLSSGNTGPYLMYQYARISSIARKVEWPQNINIKDIDYSILEKEAANDDIAKQILFELSHFQTKIQSICDDKSPSQLCDYLYSICKLFSSWYSKPQNSIKNCKDDHLKAIRLQFCECVAETIKVGIQLLGMTPLERM